MKDSGGEEKPKIVGNKTYQVKRCPNCNSISRVYDSRQKKEGYIRYRYCPACHVTFKTIEIPYELLVKMEVRNINKE